MFVNEETQDNLARNQNNVSEWSDMSARRLLFQWASTIKIQLVLAIIWLKHFSVGITYWYSLLFYCNVISVKEILQVYFSKQDIMWSSLSVTCDRSVVFSGSSATRYNWNIVESGVKHHQPNKQNNYHFNNLQSKQNFRVNIIWASLKLS
jgi:hypothetical protein